MSLEMVVVDLFTKGIVCDDFVISSRYGGQKVAIKKFTLRKNMNNHDKEVFVRRVHREIKYGYCQKHENLIQVYCCCPNYYGFGDEDSQWNLPLCIMEWGGESLRTYLKSHPSLSIKEKKNIILGIARGIQHIHSQNLVHRDLKVVAILLV